jgi:hypothetical protein
MCRQYFDSRNELEEHMEAVHGVTIEEFEELSQEQVDSMVLQEEAKREARARDRPLAVGLPPVEDLFPRNRGVVTKIGFDPETGQFYEDVETAVYSKEDLERQRKLREKLGMRRREVHVGRYRRRL